MADTVPGRPPAPAWKPVLQGVVRLCILAVPFIAAGRLDWARGWIFFGLSVGTVAINLAVMRLRNPGLLRARLNSHKPTKPFDKVCVAAYAAATLAILVIPGLGVRFHWSSLGLLWLYAGVLLHALGAIPVAWAMATNPYLETTVRIQEERAHRVIQTGPYRFVRHPMYLGIIVMASGWPLVWGMLWVYIPSAVVAILMVFRAAREDLTLQEELPGYTDYCRRTRYRLVPGVW